MRSALFSGLRSGPSGTLARRSQPGAVRPVNTRFSVLMGRAGSGSLEAAGGWGDFTSTFLFRKIGCGSLCLLIPAGSGQRPAGGGAEPRSGAAGGHANGGGAVASPPWRWSVNNVGGTP